MLVQLRYLNSTAVEELLTKMIIEIKVIFGWTLHPNEVVLYNNVGKTNGKIT